MVHITISPYRRASPSSRPSEPSSWASARRATSLPYPLPSPPPTPTPHPHLPLHLPLPTLTLPLPDNQAAQKRLKRQAAHAAAWASTRRRGPDGHGSAGVGPTTHDPRSLSPVAARAAAAAGGWKGLGEARSGGEDDESEVGRGRSRARPTPTATTTISSLASEDLEHMAYDELQAKANP